MEPVFREMVWGGRRLGDLLGKPLPAGVRIGESWEVADHPRGRSRVAEGPFAGRTIRWLLENHGAEVLGQQEFTRGGAVRFSILVKFIDASDRLSVQVHPDDDYAARHHEGESGKTECWTVIHAEPGAWLIDGLRPGTTREAFVQALGQGTIEQHLNFRKVKTGDFIWVPAGTVHAIGPGIVLAEVQQNSDVTYRVHDWDRVGLEGTARELHVDHALQNIRFAAEAPPSGGMGRTADEPGLRVEHRANTCAFSMSEVRVDGREWASDPQGAWVVLVVLAGSAVLVVPEGQMPIRPGDTILIPAAAGGYCVRDARGLTMLVAAPSDKAPRE